MYSDVVKILESNDEEQFLKMREAALYFLCNTAQEVINNWCKEAGVTSPVGYYNNLSKKEFMIYTDRPGYMIGRAGILVDKYNKVLNDSFSCNYEIKFIEVKGGFANC